MTWYSSLSSCAKKNLGNILVDVRVCDNYFFQKQKIAEEKAAIEVCVDVRVSVIVVHQLVLCSSF